MAYTSHTWENAPATSTPLNDTRLLEMEAGITNAHYLATRYLAVNGTLLAADANGIIEFNSGTKRTFTFTPRDTHGMPLGAFVTLVNIGTADVGIIDNTTGGSTEVMTLAQGQYMRWLQSSTNNWTMSGGGVVGSNSGGSSTPNPDASIYLNPTGTTADRTSAIQSAIDSLAGTNMGQNLQGSGGTWQGGSAALGGGRVVLNPGVYWVGNIYGDHRVVLDLTRGATLKRIPGVTGALVSNRRTNTRHAAYFKLLGGILDGNRDGDPGNLCTGLLLAGEEANNYTNQVDEDYDLNCWVTDTVIRDFTNAGVRMYGGGGNKLRGLVIERNNGVGMDLTKGPANLAGGQDNQINGCHVSWSGLEGVLIDGESVTMVDVKSWYSGAITAARGHGFKITADSGSYGVLNAQDNRASGLLLDNAFNIGIAGLLLDSNSRGSAGTYPALDVYASNFNPISAAIARNRYRANSAVGEQAYALRIGNGSIGNDIVMAAGVGVWGQSSTFLQPGSTPANNYIRINGTVQ